MTTTGQRNRIGTLLGVACALIGLTGAPASAATEAAFSVYGGWSTPSGWLDLDGGGTLGGAVTLREGRWKIDILDVSWRRLNMSDYEDDLRFIDVMMNVWYDLLSWKDMTLNVGGGVGYTYGTLMNDDFESSDSVVWNAGLGGTWKINHRFRLTPRYRAVGHRFNFMGDSGQVVTHEFTLGIELIFSDLPRPTKN